MKKVIQVSELSKRYRLGLKEKQSDTLVEQVSQILRSPYENLKRLRKLNRFGQDDESVFWALKDVGFEVKEGEVLGIIGKNGAGKSTLLKILSQITEPTSGKIEIHGRVASLLEVGTGFHPELSGRENIYMNGTILGMTRREIDSKIDEIIDFSGVEKFIDTPVKFYSSGMKIRLGFSVAAHLDPEILIVDEVLAVGDFEFQAKCLGKMEDISRNQGRTVLFVSHNLGAVSSLCSKALLLENGKLTAEGEIYRVLGLYQNSGGNTADIDALKFNGNSTGLVKFLSVTVNDQSPFDSRIVVSPEIGIRVNVKFEKKSKGFLNITLAMIRDGVRVFSVFNESDESKEGGNFISSFEIPPDFLRPGTYTFGIGADNKQGTWMWCDQAFGIEVLEIYSNKLDRNAIGLINPKQLISSKMLAL